MINRKIEKITSEILEKSKITKAPVPVDKIARDLGLEVKPLDLGKGISGVLVIESNNGVIGYNKSEASSRQRFTIAHEFGHYQLHKHDSTLFVDKGVKVLFRQANSSAGEFEREREANAFAASLLMPEKFLLKEISNNKFDLSDEKHLEKLADKFKVSLPAMTYRIAELIPIWNSQP